MNTPQQFLSDYQQILAEDTIGIVELKKVTKRLNEYFEKAKEKNSEETYRIIASPIMDKDVNDKEAFDTFVSHRKRTNHYLSNKNDPIFNKSTLADMFIKDFTNAFELDKKLLVRLVVINRILNDTEYDINDLYFQSAGRLITELDQSSNNWHFWTDLLDRRVRNSASHLNFYYDEENCMFKGKEIVKIRSHGRKIKRINSFSISPDQFLNVTLPNAINASQSFWAAGILQCLRPYSEYYEKAIDHLN